MILFSAPEVQHKSCFSSSSDMYSLGMVYIACFNSGQSVIQVAEMSFLTFILYLQRLYFEVYLSRFAN